MIWLYDLNRVPWMIPFIFSMSVVVFLLIQAPPGDFATTYIEKLGGSNELLDQATIDSLRARFGRDQPLFVHYFTWVRNLLPGDFRTSFEWRQPANELVWEHLARTLLVSMATLLFTLGIAFPIGVYPAIHKWQRLSGGLSTDRSHAMVDLALWGLKGKVTDQPVGKLLGGHSEKTLTYGSTLRGDDLENGLATPEDYARFADWMVQRRGVGIPLDGRAHGAGADVFRAMADCEHAAQHSGAQNHDKEVLDPRGLGKARRLR